MSPSRAFLYITLTASIFLTASCGGTTQDAPPESEDPPETSQMTMQDSTMMDESVMQTMMEESTMMDRTMMESTMMEETTGEAAPEAAPEASPEVVVVRMAGLMFQPSQVTVAPGTTVRWVSEEQAEHNVTSEDDSGPLKSDTFREGGSYEYTFEEPGEFEYLCTIHPFMKGVVIVR